MPTSTYKINQIHCASCVKTIESNLSQLPNVEQATVNFATQTLTIVGSATTAEILQRLEQLGYPSKLQVNNSDEDDGSIFLQQRQQQLLRKAAVAGTFGVVLWGLDFFPALPAIVMQSIGILTLLVMVYSGGEIYRNAWRAFLQHQATMDTLIAIGTGAAWLFSQVVTVFPHWIPALAQHVYFDTALIIIAFVNLGAALEIRARGKTSAAIKKLIGIQAKTANVIHNGEIQAVPIEAIKLADIVQINPGEKIPVDGIIIEGESHIDESMITGESMPVNKTINAIVIGGTINGAGSILVKVTKVGEQTLLSQVIAWVQQAQNSKPALARLADQVASVFVPAVLCIAIITALIWFNVGPEPKVGFMLVTAMTVLVIACPCALGLAVPISVMVGMGRAASSGILIRNGEALQRASQITTVVMDKTGTLTAGKPELTACIPLAEIPRLRVLQWAASLEIKSEHPIAQAIVRAARAESLNLVPVTDFKVSPGLGIQANLEQHQVFIGNEKFMRQNAIDLSIAVDQLQQLTAKAMTPIFMAHGQKCIALLAVADPIKSDSKSALARLKQAGLKLVMLTGDHPQTAAAVAAELGIDTVIAEVLPQEKALQVQRLQEQRERVAMVGDGINDAPALAQADVGFAIGAGTDIAIASADITLISNSLNGVAEAMLVSRATIRNMKQNLWGALIYNGLSIPVAAGILYPFTKLLLNPMLAGAAMAFSSVTVVANANRLRTTTLRT